ncbi:MAG: pirin-related protein [Micavibrio sp.]|nr:pirin-related protein [Micavibrio sp.]
MSLIELTIPAREADIGTFRVHRLLPYRNRRMVGPFIFLDHMGPAELGIGEGMDVRPHPHIGLATVTYLFDGEIIHRDTLGSNQLITPGDVNWMTAGSGISHSERTGAAERTHLHRVHGLQSWVALPKECEEKGAEFFHHGREVLPLAERNGVQLKIIAGEAYGSLSPVTTYSPLFYVEARMQPGSKLELPENYTERAVYVIAGRVRVGNTVIEPLTLPVFMPDGQVRLEADSDAHIILLGGEPLPEKRFIWWNFVSTSRERIEQAKHDWQEGRFGKIPGDETEYVPLPPDY